MNAGGCQNVTLKAVVNHCINNICLYMMLLEMNEERKTPEAME